MPRPSQRPRHSTTLDEVATRSGVSRATVSRVVNGNPKVTPAAQQAVHRAIGELGYVPNRAARSLVTRRSDSVALVIPEPTSRLFMEPFFPAVLRGASEAVAARDVQLVLLMAQSGPEEGRIARYLSAGHADGVLLLSLHGSDPLPALLNKRGVPFVVGGKPPTSGVSFVDVDNRHGAELAVQHLIGLGRRRIATIAGPADMAAGLDRLAGYRSALTAAGIPPSDALVEVADFSREGGATAMARLLDRTPDLDGVFAASDLMAVGAMSTLARRGLRVPNAVAVVGFDDSPLAESTDPPLTSVRQPMSEMGREMVRLLFTAMEDREAVTRSVILGTELVVRGSSGES